MSRKLSDVPFASKYSYTAQTTSLDPQSPGHGAKTIFSTGKKDGTMTLFLVSYNFKTSEKHTLLAFPKPLRAAHCYYWIDTNSVVVYDPQLLLLEIDSKYRI